MKKQVGLLALLPLLVAGCGATPVKPTFALAATLPLRDLTAVTDGPTWPAEVRADAPWATFARAERPMPGKAYTVQFVEAAGDGGKGQDKDNGGCTADGARGEVRAITYRTDVPFTLMITQATKFAIPDADATDGEATVAFPPGALTGYLKRPLDAGTALAATDPLYFRRETVVGAAGREDDWLQLDARAVPFPYEAQRGPDRLHLAATASGPRGVNRCGFTSCWVQGGTPAVPPLPPTLVDLTAPEALVAGETGDLAATVTGPLPAGATYRWRTTDPDGVALPEIRSAGPAAPWPAPPVPGTYRVDVVVETPYFRATAPQPRPIRVRRELFLDSYGKMASPVPDAAISEVADTWAIPAGRAVAITIAGTMNPWGAPNAPYCGLPEAAAMYPTPGRDWPMVAVDPCYFFAGLTYGPCGPFAPVKVGLVRQSVDGGTTWTVPRPTTDVYSTSHRYAFPHLVGTGSPFRAKITDTRVWDNYGQFKITLEAP